MKKILLLLFLFAAIYSKAQFPNTTTSGNASTLQKANGAYGASIGYVFAGSYGDTTAANLSFIKNIPGILIRNIDTIWQRNNAATAWIKIGGGVLKAYVDSVRNSLNLDRVLANGGTLTADRNISGAFAYKLIFTNFDQIQIWSPVMIEKSGGGISSDFSISTNIASISVNSQLIRIDKDSTNITGTNLHINSLPRNASASLKNIKYDTATNKVYYYDDQGGGSTDTTSLSARIDAKEDSFTETAQEFTGSTSMSITLSNTPKSGKAEMYFLNGVAINQSNVSRTGTGVTLSGFTRWSSDVITAKYSY